MTEKEITKMLRKAEFNTEFDDYVIENRHRFERFAKLVADKRVEGMVMMTHDEFKSVWDTAQAEEREKNRAYIHELELELETTQDRLNELLVADYMKTRNKQ
jgi:hypothetical protein